MTCGTFVPKQKSGHSWVQRAGSRSFRIPKSRRADPCGRWGGGLSTYPLRVPTQKIASV